MSTAADAVPTSEKPRTEVERVVDTFIAPSKTFTDIRRNASWWVPFLMVSLAWVALVWVVDKQIGMETVTENQLRLSPKQEARMENMPPDQRASAMALVVKVNRIIFYAFPVIFLIFDLIFAGVMLGTMNFGFGATLKFGQCMAVATYSGLPTALKTILAILLVAIGSNEGFIFQNPLAGSNLGMLVDPQSHFLFAMAVSFDAFMIWAVILAGIGYSCLTRVKRTTCMIVVFTWWLIMVLVLSALGALSA